MNKLFPAYRILALVVGVLLTVLVFIAMPLKYWATDGSSLQQFGDTLTMIVAIGHGYIYMAYLVVAFVVSRRARWSLPFTVLVLAAGLVPILIFWVEHTVSQRLRAQFPELAGDPAPAPV